MEVNGHCFPVSPPPSPHPGVWGGVGVSVVYGAVVSTTGMIRYSLNHPATPRPLRFGTMRWLRHWTIHRAWQLYRRKQRAEWQAELQRQWDQMRRACDELAKTDQRLFRIATAKKDVSPFPLEMRIPTDTPPRDGWNHAWKRPAVKTKARVSR